MSDEEEVPVLEKPGPLQDIVRMDLELGQLREWKGNPNSMDENEFRLLVENIIEVGFIDPVTAVEQEDGTYLIIGGAHRWKAAKELGMDTIPVDVVQGEQWDDADLVKFQNVRLNVIHGKMDPEKFLNLYNEMADKYGKEKLAALMGYTSDAGLRSVIKNVSKGIKDVLPPEKAKEFDERAKNARSIGDLHKIIEHLFQENGDTLQYGFMTFAWGGKEHIYIAMSKKVHKAMKRIMKYSASGQTDINELLGDAIDEVAESLEKGDNTDSEE